MILAKIQAPFPISFLHKRRHGEKQGVFHVKHRCGDVSRETSQGRASLRDGELKERRFRAEIIYFLVCCHFLFAAKGSVHWRRCGRKMGRAAATPGRPKSAGRPDTGESAPEAEAMQRLAARLPGRRLGKARQRLTPCGRCDSLSRSKSRGMPDARGLNRSRRRGLGRSARHPPDGGLWLRLRPEQARPDAVRRSPKKRRTSCDVRLERSP